MEIISIEPRLARSGDQIQLLVVSKDVWQQTCYVRIRGQSAVSDMVLESVVKSKLSRSHLHLAIVNCKLPAILKDASSVIRITASADGQFPTESEHLSVKVAHGKVSPSDLFLIAPRTIQTYHGSSIVLAIRDSAWFRSILPCLSASSSLRVRVSFFRNGLDETQEYGAHLYPTSSHEFTEACDGVTRVAAYLEAHLSFVPNCDKARVSVSFDRSHFVDSGSELSVIPSFSIIRTLPPVLNSTDTAGLVVLCSSSEPLLPNQGQFPDVMPKCWSLNISGLPLTNGSQRENSRVRAQLAVILSQPRQDEIQMLQSLVVLQKQHTRTSMSKTIEFAVDRISLTLSKSGESVHQLALSNMDVEFCVNCQRSIQISSLGPLWCLNPKVSTSCSMKVKTLGIKLASASKAGIFELIDTSTSKNTGTAKQLYLPVASNLLDDFMSSAIEVNIISRKQRLPLYDTIFTPSVSETLAHGCIPISEAHMRKSCSNSTAGADFLSIHLDPCHHCCVMCELNMRIVISERSSFIANTQSTRVYAFRSCSVRVGKHNMEGRLLINLVARSNQAIKSAFSPEPEEILRARSLRLGSSYQQVHAFDKNQWMIREAIPSSSLIEREIEIQLRGFGFKHVLEASLRVCLEMEDGKVLETAGTLADDGIIIFTTPHVSDAQVAKLRVAFDFGNATLWSNSFSFRFCSYPTLRGLFPLLAPNSSGGTISLIGDFARESDSALQMFFFSPMEKCGIEVDDFVPAATTYSTLTRHAMKPGIAPAFAVAMQVRAAGGTCAAAAAAAGAASITAASGTDFENIDAMVTDAVRATGGTKGVAMVASHTAVFHANSRNARSGVIDLHRADVRGTLSLYLRQNVDATDSCAQTSSLQGAGSTDSLINLKLHKHAPKPRGRLLAEIAPGNSDPCFIKALTQFVDSKRITCIVPPNLPLHSVHLAFSKSGKEGKQVHLFTVGGVWPVCGEATGGTLLRISGLGFDRALSLSQEKDSRVPQVHDAGSASESRDPTQTLSQGNSRLARTQSFLPHASKPPPYFAARQATSNNACGHMNHSENISPSAPVQSKSKSIRRTMSVRLGNEKVLSLPHETPNIQASVLFKLASPATGRVLHRTIVNGTLACLSAAQVANACSAGASAFSALAGAGESLMFDRVHAGESASISDPDSRTGSSLHPSTAVGIAAAENAVKTLGLDSVVQCRTPPCPLALLMNAVSFSATVEVSFSGPDGPFSIDNALYEYVRPVTLKAILPAGDHLVPGHSVLSLKGHSIISSKALTLHMSLLAAPEGGTSHFGHVRTLDRLVLSYKLLNRKPNGTAENVVGSATPGGDDADPDKVMTQVCAAMPFFVRRRYFNRQARHVPMFPREIANIDPPQRNQSQMDSIASNLPSTSNSRQLHLWVHSQPVVEETRRRLDAEHMPPPSCELDSHLEKTSRLRRASIRRQMSSSPQRHLLRQLSRTESLKRSGNSLVRQLSDLAEPYRKQLGRISSQRIITSPSRAPEKFKRPAGQFRLGDRQISRSGLTKQAAETLVRRTSRLRQRTGTVDNAINPRSSYMLVEPDCLINEVNIELSPNGQDWTERASRKVQLVTPHSFSHVEPSLGPTHGGTNLTIYGDSFPIVGEICIVAFLCLGSSTLPTNTQTAEFRGRNITGHFIDVNIASLESHAAARKIQAASRGHSLRALANGGLPCSCVIGLVTSTKSISCVTPSVLFDAGVDIVISFDGTNFEWAPTEKLRQIRIAHLLLELGIGAEDAAAAAAAISSGLLNEEHDDAEQDLGSQTTSGLNSSLTTEIHTPTSIASLPRDNNVALVVSPDSTLFETKLHLTYYFYAPPWLQRVLFTRGPYTDTLQLLGGQFPLARQAMIRFESPLSNTNLRVCSSVQAGPFVESDLKIETLDVNGDIQDSQVIRCFAPPTLPSGRDVRISISMNGGHDYSGSIFYKVNKSPILTSLRPSCGPRSGGTAIFIHGQNFASRPVDIKVRFSLALGKFPSQESVGRKLCTVSAVCESSTTIKCRLPPFEQLLSNINSESHAVRQKSDSLVRAAELKEESRRFLSERTNVNNSIVSLWVDVCTLGGSLFTGRPLLFLLYDHFPKLGHMRPHSGALSGGYKVKLIGNGFLKTNSITARIIPLPTAIDYATAASSRSLELSRLLSSKKKRRRGAVLDHRSTSQRNDVAMSGLDSVWPLTSVGNKTAQMRPIAVRCRYHSDTEVSFIMPWLLGRQSGPSLVQVSLNSSEFSEPHERCIFHLFRDHRSRDVEFFPSITGPQDVNTSRYAHRQFRRLNAAKHRPFAHNADGARNNKLAHLRYLSASTSYEARPCMRSILNAAVSEVDEKGAVDMSEVVSLARLNEAPLQLLDINLSSFDTHPALKVSSSDAHVPAHSHKHLALIDKLQLILHDKVARLEFVQVLNRAFFVLLKGSSRKGIAYGELCDQLMLVLFPSSTQMDLLSLWKLSDPKSQGYVSLSEFLQQLRGKRPRSPVPGPSHYNPNPDCIERAVMTVFVAIPIFAFHVNRFRPILLVAVRSRSIFMRSPVTSRHIIRICEHCVLLLAFVSLDSFHLLISIQAE